MSTRQHIIRAVSATMDRNGRPGMIVSTSTTDLEGDRVYPEGLEIPEKNLPLIFSHDYSALPIGAVREVEVVPGRELRAWWDWLEGDARAAQIKNAWQQGVLRAASIGFSPTKTRPNEFGGVDVLAARLHEVSLTAIGANPEAVRSLKAWGLLPTTYEVDPAELDRLTRQVVRAEVRNLVASAIARHTLIEVDDDLLGGSLDAVKVGIQAGVRASGLEVQRAVVSALRRQGEREERR